MNSGVLKGYAVPCSLIKCAATSASTAILCNISQHLYVLQLVLRFKLVVMYYIGSQHFSRWQYNTVVPHILADDNIAQWVPTFQPTEIQHSGFQHFSRWKYSTVGSNILADGNIAQCVYIYIGNTNPTTNRCEVMCYERSHSSCFTNRVCSHFCTDCTDSGVSTVTSAVIQWRGFIHLHRL